MAMKGENEIIVKEEEREFSAIDVDDLHLADSIQSSIQQNPSKLCSIYRVPYNLKKGNEDKYKPSVVSIGPYHHDKQNLKITEKHKLWYLGKLISRSTPPKTSLKDMVQAVKNIEEKARACYVDEIHLSHDNFVKMMVIDGCFILELFYRFEEDHRQEDLIYSAPWVIETVRQDLLLLENQLPFIILVCLYQLITYPKSNLLDLDLLVCEFFNVGWPARFTDLLETNHILDFLRNRIMPHEFYLSADPMSFLYYYDLPCAKDLQEMGVKFKSKTKLSCLDITFEEGYLTLPYLPKRILYSLFPNWIALEQCHCHFEGYITSYTLLLGQLINSKDDVKFLRKVGIFAENENEDEKFATEVRMLCQRAKPIENHYASLGFQVRRYTRTGWTRQRANLHNWNVILKRDYFSSPWAVISFIAAIFLLVLTVIQTVLAFLSYSPKV